MADDAAAELIVGRRQFSCQLVEISIGNFGVVVPRSFPDLCEPLLQLRTRGLTYIVRVVRRKDEPDGVHLALDQVEEVLPNNSLIPATLLGRWLTGVAWATAIGLVVTAVVTLAWTHF